MWRPRCERWPLTNIAPMRTSPGAEHASALREGCGYAIDVLLVVEHGHGQAQPLLARDDRRRDVRLLQLLRRDRGIVQLEGDDRRLVRFRRHRSVTFRRQLGLDPVR